MPNDLPERLPCPHCGRTDVRDTGSPGHYSVACACFRGGFETREGAINRWNARVTTAAPIVKQLCEALIRTDARRSLIENPKNPIEAATINDINEQVNAAVVAARAWLAKQEGK